MLFSGGSKVQFQGQSELIQLACEFPPLQQRNAYLGPSRGDRRREFETREKILNKYNKYLICFEY